ncbi:MAG: hypothetical protein PUH38_08690, partial [Acidaminococcus fermentans]|uniref:hypothetical protein n=1 Tax=Acidaminococcus fermentans TaxID=905 RepID=UPI00242CF33F
VELTWNERKFVNDVLAQNVKDVLAQNVNDVMLDRPAAPTGTIDTTIPVVQTQFCWFPSAVVSAGKFHCPAPPCSRK